MSPIRRMLTTLILCAIVPAARGADAPLPTPATQSSSRPAPLADDERAIAAIIAALGSADPDEREAASRRLEGSGPEVIPVLQRYADTDDPEVANRVRNAIDSFVWMKQGAMIFEVTPGSQAERLGIAVGDVLVKAGDLDVNSHLDLAKIAATDEAPATGYFWRAGAVRTAKLGGGKIGITCSNWDIAKGGNDQSRGLAALSAKPPQYEEAYRRLKAAREQGMGDTKTLFYLAGLAARNLDGATAIAAHAQAAAQRTSCSYTHENTDQDLGNIPFNSAHSWRLLGRYRGEAFSPHLYHELADWTTRNGRNGPLATEVLAKPWPAGAGAESDLYYHGLALMHVRLRDRAYDEVLQAFDARADRDNDWYDRPTLALQAAVGAGRGDVASRIALGLLQSDEYEPRAAWYGFACAAAAGDAAACDAFVAGVDKLPAERRRDALSLRSMIGLQHPAAAERVRAWLAKRPRAERPGDLEQVALARLIATPDATAEQFAAAIEGYRAGKLGGNLEFTLLTGLLRFGRYDDAAAAAAAFRAVAALAAKEPCARLDATVAFARAHANELAGPWKQLRGMIEVLPAREAGSTWVLRFDGKIFLVDAAGAVKSFEGLAEPPTPVTIAYDHLRLTPDAVAALFPYGRAELSKSNADCPDVIYVMDAKRGRWLPLAESEGALDWGDGDAARREMGRVLAVRAVAKAHPAPAGTGGPRAYKGLDDYHWFEGDLMVHVDRRTGRTTDLSAEIARRAGRPGAAAVYHVHRRNEPRQLVLSDAGAWTFEPATGILSRIALGLKDGNVITCELPESLYGKRADGTLLVGVAPQQAGAIFVVDLRTGTATPTGGLNGLGPEDWFAEWRDRWGHHDPQPAIHAQYLARVEAKR